MTDLEKRLKRIADLLECHLGDTDPVLPDDQDVLEDEFPVHAAMQLVVELMQAARATAEQRDSLIEECAQACDAERKNFFRAEDSAGDGIDGCIDAIRALKSQQDAAIEAKPAEQPDTERLDFMIEQRVWIQWTLRDGSIRQCQVYDQNEDEEYLVVSGEDRYFNTAREALDAAIASQRSGDGS